MTATQSTSASPKNFALFGAANAGKSTLAGYCTLRTGGLAESWQHFIRDRRIQLGRYFNAEQKFAYILDRSYDEQVRSHDQLGNSRRAHPTTALLDVDGQALRINMIDTPGSKQAERERYSGMFMGDAGLFVVEVGHLLKDSWASHPEFMAALATWIEFKRGARFAVVLSKMDQCGYEQDSFDRAYLKLRTVLRGMFDAELSFEMIPTSIDVEGECDENVITPPGRMPWYGGPTVIDWIRLAVRDERCPIVEGPGRLAYVQGDYPRKARSIGVPLLLRAKVLQGSFLTGEAVQVAPVRLQDGSYGTVTARIRSLRAQGAHESVGSLGVNDLGGFGLASIRGSVHPRLCKSTCLFGAGDHLVLGRAVVIRLDSEARLALVGEMLSLIWFGKLVDCRLIGRAAGASDQYVFEVAGGPVALASPFDKLSHDVFYLRRGARAGPHEFLAGHVMAIGDVTSISVLLPEAADDVRRLLAQRKYQVSSARPGPAIDVSCRQSASQTLLHIDSAMRASQGETSERNKSRAIERYEATVCSAA